MIIPFFWIVCIVAAVIIIAAVVVIIVVKKKKKIKVERYKRRGAAPWGPHFFILIFY